MSISDSQVRWLFLLSCLCFSAILQWNLNAFSYYRIDMLQEPWRWWTASWVHVGWRHYALNMVAFVLISFIFPHVRIRTLSYCLLLFAPLLTGAMYLWMPNVYAYAGLSGILHGMYVYIALQGLAIAHERKFSMLVLGCIVLKVAWEKITGYSETAQLIQAPVLIESHQVGLVIGVLAAVFYYAYYFVRSDRHVSG